MGTCSFHTHTPPPLLQWGEQSPFPALLPHPGPPPLEAGFNPRHQLRSLYSPSQTARSFNPPQGAPHAQSHEGMHSGGA